MRGRAAFIIVFVAVVVGLPVLGHWWRRGGPARCALDGQPIDAIYRVDVGDAQGTHALCCVRCAELWLERAAAPPGHVTVTDEASGQRLPAAAAWYVRSSVMTHAITGNRIHVFRTEADAEAHADRFGGIVLGPDERPFRGALEDER